MYLGGCRPDREGVDTRQVRRHGEGSLRNGPRRSALAGSSAPNSDAELVERVRKLQPLIRSHALRTEQERRVTGEVVTALTDAGVPRMNVPRRYGGYQTSVRTQVDVLSEVSAACG